MQLKSTPVAIAVEPTPDPPKKPSVKGLGKRAAAFVMDAFEIEKKDWDKKSTKTTAAETVKSMDTIGQSIPNINFSGIN